MPFAHSLAKQSFCAGVWEKICDEGNRVRARTPTVWRIFPGDASDGHQGLGGEGPDLAEGFEAGGGIGILFCAGSEHRTVRDIVDCIGDRVSVRGFHLGDVVGGKPYDGRGTDYGAGIGGEQIFLAEMKPGVLFSEKPGIVGAVVNDEQDPGLAAQLGNLTGPGEGFAGPEGLVAVLKDFGPAFEQGFSSFDRAEPVAFKRSGIENRVNLRQFGETNKRTQT